MVFNHPEAQALRVLNQVRTQVEEGYSRGKRHGRRGPCLLGAIDSVTQWTIPGVREEVQSALIEKMPRRYRFIAAMRPRFAISLFNDLGSQARNVALLSRATEQSILPELELITN